MKFVFPHQFKDMTAEEKFKVIRDIAKGDCMICKSTYQAMNYITNSRKKEINNENRQLVIPSGGLNKEK